MAQIARTVATALDLNEELTEALALGHDIGHPPFAHAGEDELDRQMRRFGDRFDHNLHALRIVESFEHRYARFPGLNLTFEVREGIVKHSHDFEKGENPALDEYLPGLRPPLEAQLIDLADEIAYNTADLDDGFSAGLFSIEEVSQWVPEFGRRWEEVESQFPGASEREQFQEVLRGLLDWLVSGLVEGTVEAADAASVANVDDGARSSPALGCVHFAGSHRQSRAETVPASHAVLFRADGGRAPPLRRPNRRAIRILGGASGETSRELRAIARQFAGAPRGLRLHRRNDRWIFHALLSADIGRGGQRVELSQMLTRLYIDNFRCFVGFEYRPGRTNLILGRNGSGKSSMLDALSLLRQFIVRGDRAEDLFMLEQRTRWEHYPDQMFEIEAATDEGVYHYRLVIEPTGKIPRPSSRLRDAPPRRQDNT